jgi:DNA-3-methyladenine glycosylase
VPSEPQPQPLPASFYDRPVLEVARSLLGCVVVTGSGPQRMAVRLTEVEAYAGPDDPGSHAFRGPTPRTTVMFGPPGHAYVYFSYGMHWCMNVVSGPQGRASAVLLRAGEPVWPEDADARAAFDAVLAERRPGIAARDLARGPARLTKVLAVDRADDGADVTDPVGRLRILPGPTVADDRIRTGPRVGLSVATERPWRYWVDGERSVSAFRPGKPRRR